MEINITEEIEKTLRVMIKGKWGNTLANLYKRYYIWANIAIIVIIGILFNTIISGIFNGILSTIISFIVACLWIWMNFVGPFAYMWGFGKKKEKTVSKIETPKTFIVGKEEVQDIEKEKST